MITENKKFLVLLISIGILLIGVAWTHLQFEDVKELKHRDEAPYFSESDISRNQKEISRNPESQPGDIIPTNVSTTDEDGQAPPDVVSKSSEPIGTETIICGTEKYIFDFVLLNDKDYINIIYKTARSPENFMARLKSSRGGDLGFFSVLATPRKNCDRIYLTTGIAETDAPLARIFAWHINEKEAHELATSNELSDINIPFRGKEWVSPDGERIITAQEINPKKDNQWCDYRLLRFINLREDISRTLLQLPETETLDNGYSDVSPYCAGLNFGWLNESTIYYDVYDATKGVFDTRTESNRPFLERRVLKINRND